jgi:succinoglycan biosynthesis transport protein ExoP
MDELSRTIGIDHAHHGTAEPFSAATSMSALIEQLTGFVRRQYRIFVIVPAAAIALGLLYLMITPALYTATATVLIDGSALRALQNQLQPQGDVPLDTVQVGSQVEILASDKIALAVIRELGLAEDPEFIKSNGIFIPVWPWTRDAGSKLDKALDEFVNHRSISRVERTYALNISYTSRDADTAAKIANAIADAYINDQLEAKYQTTHRAGAWLQDRLNELKAQVTTADQAVLEFKKKNNIVDFGGTSGTANAGPSSRLIGEQQLFDLNSQLSAARVATSEARARLERIEQVRKLDVGEAAVSDTLRNEVITRLRNQYLDLSAREANWSSRYGRDHLAASNLRDQMEEIRRNIGAELGRIAASYQSDFEIAKTREENLDRALASLIAEGQVTNRDRVGLAELESSAKSYHAIYDNFLQRYMEAMQQQSFPITDARVIDPATPPTRKSKPVNSLVLAIAATMGIILSLGMAALREAIDGVFRTRRQIEQILRIKCLSVIPLLTKQAVSAPEAARPVARRTHPFADAWRASNRLSDASETPGAACFAFDDPLMRRAVDEPLSVFAEAFRAIKVAAEIRAATRDNKVIGITSTLPNEGKSTVAANLAVLMADTGRRVILVDADLRNPTLMRTLTPRPTVGLMELLTGKIDLQQAIGRESDTGLTLLPLVLDEQLAHSDEILSSQAFKGLIDQLRQRYDFVVLDLPPIAPVVDVLAAVPAIDSLVFVVEWGSTKINAVQHHLMGEPELHDRLLGVVLNKADLKALERFDQQGLYQNGYYANQGYRQSARSN